MEGDMQPTLPQARLVSLDAFRGFTLHGTDFVFFQAYSGKKSRTVHVARLYP